jgi:hypothetical protein
MGLSAHCWLSSRRSVIFGGMACLLLLFCASPFVRKTRAQAMPLPANAPAAVSAHVVRARRFLEGRTLPRNFAAARAMDAAREQQAAMLAGQRLKLPVRSQARSQPESQTRQVTGLSALDVPAAADALNAPWQPLGPAQVASIAYGKITGRVTSIALDPSDASGNTVYLGTTGGGVWKSVNAAGPAAAVTFTPLTDTLPVFSANAGTAVIPSLSIGAVSVQPGAQSGVVLAGTGDPNDAADSFYGDGILRSADKGVTWTLIRQSNDGATGAHSFLGLGFAGFAWSSLSPDTVVAAVSQAAEGTLVNADDSTYSVMGLYYSTDAGVSWHMSIIRDGGQTVQQPQPSGLDHGGNAATSVVWNPIRQRFYAAIRYHGYYESPDGATWTRLVHQPGSGLTTTDCPPNPDTAGSLSCSIFRGALAVQPDTGDTFALTVDSGNRDQGLWQDVCNFSGGNCASNAVTFAARLPSAPLEAGNDSTVIPQADYDLALAAVPSRADTLLYVGTIDLYRCSLAGGCLLRNTTNAVDGCATPAMVAPAQHAIAALANSALLYLGNDGGLWRSADGVDQQGTPCSADDAAHFQNLNGGLGSLAEVTSFAEHPTDPETLIAGLGANGTAATSAASSSSAPWTQLSSGEGGTVAIAPDDPRLWYISTGAGVSIGQCSSGAGCTAADFAGPPAIGAAETAGDASLIDAPWLLDPALSSDILVGTCRVWRGSVAGGASWSSSNAISRLFGGSQNASCDSTNSMIRSLAAGGPASEAAAARNAGSETLYAGMAGTLDGGGSVGGHLFSTTSADTADGATAWTDLGVFNPGGFDISSIAADPHDATGETVYATVMGFSGNGINAPHLYRSTDAGAHWANISGNLPDAPANSVLVDPNDANTVYVALDTGVYVTRQVAACADTGANCWSIYGSSLPNAPVIQLAAAAGLPTGDGRTGELRAATYGRGIWQIPLLTTAGPVQAAISLHPAALAFDTQVVSTAGAPQTVTVTNTGAAPLTISRIAVTGDFYETDDCAAAVASGHACAIVVRFLPSATGDRTGLLTVYGNVPGGQATASLSGTGSAAAVVLDPVAVVFPATTVNAASAARNITLSNTGAAAVTLEAPAVAGSEFRITADTCGALLAAGTGCTVAVTFTPAASGTRTGTFTITGSAGTQTASLSGTGVLPATDALSPLSLDFAPEQLATASAPRQVILTNSGDTALTLIAAQITSNDFTVTNACGNSLNPHSACALNIAFAPRSIGQAAGVLTISDQYRSQSVALMGTGVAPPGVSLSPIDALSFPATGVGQSALPRTITLTNNGGLPLQLQGTALTGDFAMLPGSNTCGATLAPANACTFQIIFAPTAAGVRSGALTVTDSAPNSPQTLRLTGSAIDFALSPDGETTVTVASGQNAVFPLLLTPSAALDGTATLACAGVPLNAACEITPASIPLDAVSTVSVVVLTGVPGGASTAKSAHGQHRPAFWLALLMPLGLLALGRRLPRLACLVLLCCLLFPAGCGAGRQVPAAGASGGSPAQATVTPAGTYPIVVSATSAEVTRTIDLTLIVK